MSAVKPTDDGEVPEPDVEDVLDGEPVDDPGVVADVRKDSLPSRKKRLKASREFQAAAVIVPGFPEIVGRVSVCRLCQLVDADPDFLRRIHKLWQQGNGVRRLESDMWHAWTSRGEKVADHKTYHRHLRSHCDFSLVDGALEAAMSSGTAAGGARATREMVPVKVKAQTHAGAQAAVEGAPDYVDMEALLAKLRDRMAEVDDNVAFIDDEGRVNSYGIIVWLKLVSEFRQAVESMSRMKNSERLIKAILQSHTKRMAQLISAPLVERFEVVVTAMREGRDEDLVAGELERLASSDIKSLILQAAETAVAESCEVYKLH